MQNLQRVGKNDGPILNSFWTKVHEISRRRRGSLVVSDILVYIMFRSEDIRH